MNKATILSSVHIALDNRVFYREATSLQRAGYDVSLIAVHDCSEEKDGIKITGLPRVPRWQRPRLWSTILRSALRTAADVYHFHDPELLLLAAWLRRITGKPTIYDVHEANAEFFLVKDYMPAWLRYPIAYFLRWGEPLLARLHSALIFADDEIARTFDRLELPKTTLFNYPRKDFIEKAVTETRGKQRLPVILHLGGHERNRGSRIMIEAFQLVIREFPEARLTLVGPFTPPGLQSEVQEDVNERGLAHAVTIVGRVPYETVGDYLKTAMVGWVPWQAYPKNQKNIPTKLFEYMAYGLPIVSSDLFSTRPFVQNGVNGYLVPADDPAGHAGAILGILRSPGEAKAMSDHAQKMVLTRYNWDTEQDKLLNLYRRVVG